MAVERRRRRRVRRYLKGVPFLPSLLTLGNAFCGFLAIVKVTDAARLAGEGAVPQAAVELVEAAGLLILLAMVFDGLDGKVARLTDQTSRFGAELDSLADVVTFGIAPAVIAKFLITVHHAPSRGAVGAAHQLLPYHPRIYYVCAAVYALFAVLRLARFNVEVTDTDESAHEEFEGLPSPAAAAFVTSLILFWCAEGERNSLSRIFFTEGVYDAVIIALPGVLLGCGLLMVSRFPYPHVMNRLLRGRKTFPSLVAAVIILILGVLEWQIVLLALNGLYLITGPVLGTARFARALVTGRGNDDDDVDSGEPPPGVVEGPGARSLP